jgi:hypothetical protein
MLTEVDDFFIAFLMAVALILYFLSVAVFYIIVPSLAFGYFCHWAQNARALRKRIGFVAACLVELVLLFLGLSWCAAVYGILFLTPN